MSRKYSIEIIDDEMHYITRTGRDTSRAENGIPLDALALTSIASELAEANELKLREIKALEQLAFHGLKPI